MNTYRNVRNFVKSKEVETLTVVRSRSQSVTRVEEKNEITNSGETEKDSSRSSRDHSPVFTPVKLKEDSYSDFKTQMKVFNHINDTVNHWRKSSDSFMEKYTKELKTITQSFKKHLEPHLKSTAKKPDPTRKPDSRELRHRGKNLFPEEKTSPEFTDPRECITPPSFGIKKLKLDTNPPPLTQCHESLKNDSKYVKEFEAEFMQTDVQYSATVEKGPKVFESPAWKLYLIGVKYILPDGNKMDHKVIMLKRSNQCFSMEFAKEEELSIFLGRLKFVDEASVVEMFVGELIEQKKVEFFKIEFEPFDDGNAKLIALKRTTF